MSQKKPKAKHKEFSSQLDTLYNLSKIDGDVTIIIISPAKDDENLYEPLPKKQRLNTNNNENKNEETGLDESKTCSLKASSLILRSASPVFYGMLCCEMLEKQKKEIKITAKSEEDVDNLLYFMCTNSLRDNANVYNIIHLAHYYQMDRLFNACILRLKCNIHIETFIQTVKIFDYFEIEDGYHTLVKFGAENIKQLKKLDDFDTLSHAFKHSLKTQRISDALRASLSNDSDPNHIRFQMIRPSPRQHETLVVKTRINRSFGRNISKLKKEFGKPDSFVMNFSYEGIPISENDTPEKIIGEGFSDGDLIDVTYTYHM